ncbi:sigma-70 family RNA polymerase sigma factor [Kordia sp. YSTF-M3]|uniref:RNA polymerase sigma factor n=1 Tax=Kordia aestuariivivens TaxID=2759037 RepID=A0ABR7QCM6_9FLAO|nr:sigma-70 family RNA polymerase sigma factor [Kordia aestuariivivens]MBC8756329.1 sigma-70 family RNA polymerase sigma factor [Kordia aestuariivivens]
MNQKTDHDYILEIRSGNVNAYAMLVNNYKDMIFTLALRMVGNREDAEEVAQDTFVKAYKALDSFKGTSKFSTWLYRIVYNTSLDYIKKSKRVIYSEHIDTIHESDIGTMQDALSYLEAKEKKETIEKALLQLPEEERVLLTLFYFEDLSLKEISKIVKISYDNVKIKLHRSRKKLYHILKNVVEPIYLNHGSRK